MVNELSRPGATVSLVARQNDINSSLLFEWRKLARRAHSEVAGWRRRFCTSAAGVGFGGGARGSG